MADVSFTVVRVSDDVTAHVGGSGRRWPGTVQSRVVSRRLPHDAVHRVQRCTWYLPLLRQQVQLLAVDDRPATTVLHAAAGDAQGWQPAFACQSLPSLYQGDSIDLGKQQRRQEASPQQATIIAVPALHFRCLYTMLPSLCYIELVPGGIVVIVPLGGCLSWSLFTL